jgi:signal transduction histidine kinase/DNA-binding response OmpR family regulator
MAAWGGDAWADTTPHRLFRSTDGLPNETITALAQTPNGLLWIGTEAGLAVYDGHQIRSIELPDSIGATYVSAMRALPDGSVWVAPSTGEALKVRRHGVVRVVPLGERLVQRIVRKRETLLFVTRTAVWRLPPDAAAPTRRPFRYDIRPSNVQSTTGVGAGVFNADLGPDGTVWVIDGHLGPGRLRADGSVAFVGAPSRAPGNFWYTLRFVEEGTALVLQGEQLHRMEPATGRMDRVVGALGSPTYLSVDGSRAYVTRNQTLLRYEDAGRRPLGALGPAQGLPEQAPTEVLRGQEGGLWIGTREGLLHLPTPETRHVESIRGKPLFNVSQFLAQGEALWAPTRGMGLVQLRPTRRRVTPDGLSGWKWSGTGRDGRLHAVATKTKTWYRWRDETGWQRVRPIRDTATKPAAFSGFVLSDGEGVFKQADGLFRYPPSATATPVPLATWPDSLDYQHNVALAPNGTLVHRAGAYVYRRRADGTLLDTLGTVPDNSEPGDGELAVDPHSNMRDMAVDGAGRVWGAFAYDGGLLRVAPASSTQRVLLKDRSIWHVGVAGDSLVLAGTRRRGLYVVEARTGTVRQHLTQADGLKSNSTLATHLTADTLYVGHPNGITRLPTDELQAPPRSPEVLLTGLEVGFDERPLTIDTLRTENRTIGFSYAGVSLKHPERIRYEVRLVPQNRAWKATSRRFARYTNLEPGTYRFEVRARLAGRPPGPVATHTFTLPPRFYETGWFQLLAVLGFFGLVLGAYRWRTYRLRRRQETLEATVEERTRELAREKRKTERQAERLAELDEAKNRFFADVSHEFRTPLSLILSPLEESLRRGSTLGPTQKQRMADNARRLWRLIDQLLDLATLEAGEMELDRQPGDLAAVAERAAEAFRSKADAKDIGLHVDVPEGRIETRFDPEKVETIVSNLMGNAVKFTPDGGRVVVRIEQLGSTASVEAPGEDETAQGTVRIAVEDTGPGIDPAVQEGIFDRFEQADNSTTREHEGTGLGLALTRELVELHGGTIDVASTPGEGSTFTVRLPLVAVAADRMGKRACGSVGDGERGSVGGGERGGEGREGEGRNGEGRRTDGRSAAEEAATILVVEDNAEMRAYLREELGRRWRVLEAAGGEDGWETVQKEEPDLVVSDVMMPGTDGFELCRRIKGDAALRTIPVLLLTARADEEATLEGLQSGADDYVAKPFGPAELRQRIENHLAARAHLRERYRKEGPLSSLIAPVGDDAASPFVESVVDALEPHLDNPDFTVEQLAEEVALSRRQLSRRLKSAVGEPPSEFLRRCRIERAKTLFENGAETVAEVAYAVGYRSPSHFSQVFQDEVGTTPSAYREETSGR